MFHGRASEDVRDDERWAGLADHYGSHDTATATSGGCWHTDAIPAPMITTTLRLPQQMMTGVRAEASRVGMKPSAFIRAVLERELTGGVPRQRDLEQRVDAVEDAVRRLSP